MSQLYATDTAPLPIVIGASGMEEIAQNIRTIVQTLAYSVPMDRRFAGSGGYVDTPLPHRTAAKMAEIIDVVEKYEPRVKVHGVRFANKPDEAADGILYPAITYTLREGVVL